MHNFINREAELAWLEAAWREPRAQLLAVYGRRRIGKTALVEQFAHDKRHVYYQCTKGVEVEQIELLSAQLARTFDDRALLANPFRTWEGLFNYIGAKAASTRFILVLDEFPFLVRANPAIPSILQKYWDGLLSKTRIMLILCGSSIAMMEREVLAAKSPLYGRRTGQWKVLPFRLKEVMAFFARKDLATIIPIYAVVGGVPFYLLELDRERSALENILSRVACRGRILYEEGEFMIKEELAEPQTYFSILRAVADGRVRQAEIANAIGMSATAITRYLGTLIRLGFLERRTPVTEKPRTKRAVYAVADLFLAFWFRFIYPNRTAIEEQDHAGVARALARFNQHVAAVFERVSAEALIAAQPFGIQKIGPWWGAYREGGQRKTAEIDIVGLNEGTSEVVFAECKWQDRVNPQKVLAQLKAKAALVDWHGERRKEYFAIFAKSFAHRLRQPDTRLYDLDDIRKALRA